MLGNLFGGTKTNDNGVSTDQSAGIPPVTETTQTTQSSSATISASGPVVVAPVAAMALPTQTFQQTSTTTTTAPTSPSIPIAAPATANSAAMDPSRREDLSALSHLDSRSMQVLMHAKQEAMRVQQAVIMPEQLLFGLLYDTEIYKLLEQFKVDVAKLSREVQTKETPGTFTGQPTLSDQVKQIFETAFTSAKERSSSFIAPEDILLAIFPSSSGATLQAQGVRKDEVVAKLEKSSAYTEGRKSVLDKFGVDLTEKAKEGGLDPVAGREKEVDRLVHILLRRTKNNPIIIGEAGVGKTAIVEGLAQAIVSGNVPEELKNKKIIQIDVSSLVAGASHRGEFEERLRSVMKDTMSSGGQVILFFDEIHTLIGTGDNEGALDASNIIKPNLARGQLQIIGTTTTSEYRKYFEKDKAFARRFQPIIAEEPDEETAVKMLQVLKTKYENYHHVTIPDDALKQAVKLSKKYIGERYLPDKAVDLLDEAAAEVKLQMSAGKRQDNTIQRSDIEKVVSAWTGIPITKLTEDESQKLLELEKRIHMRLIDQEPAVNGVAEAVRRGRIGLAAANRPIASFIFLGPTGTGKTELAKTLAEILFGRDDAMVRLDMSEYMEKHEVAKLIGAPPGYVGYEEGGQLTEAVRAKPYSIVLLDEIEKAHPDVFNILLQLLEDGRLTDNKGNTISFKNTIVIATSNIGSQDIQDQLSKPTKTPEEYQKMYKEMQAKVSDDLHKFFRPELLNRFDEIIMFQPLRQQDMKYIAKLGVEKTNKLLKDQGFSLQITDGALEVLAKEGYDPQYGARPLRRLIQSAIENPIAMMIINKTFVAGDIIKIDYDQQKSEFSFTKLQPQPQAVGQTVNSPTASVSNTTATTIDTTSQSNQVVNSLNPNTTPNIQAQVEQPLTETPAVSTSKQAPSDLSSSDSQPLMQTIGDIAQSYTNSINNVGPNTAPTLDSGVNSIPQVNPVAGLTPVPSVTTVDQIPSASSMTPTSMPLSATGMTFAPPAVSSAALMSNGDSDQTGIV